MQQRRVVTGEGGNVEESGSWKMMERKPEVFKCRKRGQIELRTVPGVGN